MEQMSSGSNDRNFNEGMSAFKVCKTARRNGARHECRGRGPKGERALGMNYFYEQLIEFSSDRAKIARFAIFPFFRDQVSTLTLVVLTKDRLD